MNRTPKATIRLLLLAGTLSAIALPIAAQDATPPADPPAKPPVQPESTQSESSNTEQSDPQSESSDPLDLDDLLRLPGSGQPADRPPAEGAKPETELDRRLTGRQAQQALVQAVQEMQEVADRLDQLRDAGITTQRLQQDIITKLDILIRSAEEQSSSSSSSSSSQQQQQEQQPGQQQSQQNQQSSGQSSTPGESMPPGGQSEELNQNLDLSVAEWGNLPERLRQSLIQGQSDYFSDMYRRWTESYYRRLAEEANR